MNSIGGISVLLPAYNCDCSGQVARLCQLARPLVSRGLRVEVVVMEDGSTNSCHVEKNARACDNDLCRHIVNAVNQGRAKTRNGLMNAARYPWLLLQDTGLLVPNDNFLQNYVEYVQCHPDALVVCGGVFCAPPSFRSLRYNYEKATSARHSLESRRKNPYSSMNTCNVLLNRNVLSQVSFDERFVTYGYEDVMFGRDLRLHDIPIEHIENAVLHCDRGSNESYVLKTEEAMRTLRQFADELRDEVRMLHYVDVLNRWGLLPVVEWLYRHFGDVVRRQLVGGRPCWRLFNSYKLGYYSTLV